MPLQSYRELIVWQKSVDLVAEAFLVARHLPRDQVYGLAIQLQRAAVSVPANIAEGNGRRHRAEYVHHLSIARGSLNETEALLHVCARLGYLNAAQIAAAIGFCDEVSRLLTVLCRPLSNSS